MMTEQKLAENNFLSYAIKYYDNPTIGNLSEFEDDLKRFRYLKRLFRKYKAGKGLKERLIINHIVILNNLFGSEAVTNMLFFKIEKQYWSQLKSFLVFLNYMPIGVVINSQEAIIEGYEIPVDEKILKALQNI